MSDKITAQLGQAMRTVLSDPQGTASPESEENRKLMAQLLADWNPLTRPPVYQPTTGTSGVRG